jgi:hypothetical protein
LRYAARSILWGSTRIRSIGKYLPSGLVAPNTKYWFASVGRRGALRATNWTWDIEPSAGQTVDVVERNHRRVSASLDSSSSVSGTRMAQISVRMIFGQQSPVLFMRAAYF